MEMLNGICQGFAFIVNLSCLNCGAFLSLSSDINTFAEFYRIFYENFAMDRYFLQAIVKTCEAFVAAATNSDCQCTKLVICYA